jgi:hypothetical protein
MGMHIYYTKKHNNLTASVEESKPIKKRLSKLERSNIQIKSPLYEILIGLLLGDGHIKVVVGFFMPKVV